MGNDRIRPGDIAGLKGKRKISMLTAYDYPLARLMDKAGIDIILVGDSLANTALGLESTTQVGMAEMLHHARAVSRAVARGLVVGDMPFEAYQINPEDSLANASRFISDAGCGAVKLEWFERCPETVGRLVKAGIPVMGHIGLTPQTADKLGGFKVQGRDAADAEKLLRQALQLEEKGCFALVLECVPDKIAGWMTERLKIPTIGIGGGPYCDGQVLVVNDLLGLFDRHTPRFVKRYADLSSAALKAFMEFKDEVERGVFPDREHSYGMKEEEFRKLLDDGKQGL